MASITVRVTGGHRLLLVAIDWIMKTTIKNPEEVESSGPFGASWTFWILPMTCGQENKEKEKLDSKKSKLNVPEHAKLRHF